jgi:hypothetical protein
MPLLLPGLLSQWQEYVSTQIRSSSAPRWCVLARWSVGIALAQCCELTGVVATSAATGTACLSPVLCTLAAIRR